MGEECGKHGKEEKYIRRFWWENLKEMLKYTLVQALRLCTGRTAHRGSRGIALLFHDQR